MEKEAWAREYKKLITAYNKTSNSEQARVYFEALSSFPAPCVADAVTSAIRESKHWPSAADLAERARLARPAHLAPASASGMSGGSTWVTRVCSPERPCGADHPKTTRVAVREGEALRFTDGPFVHDYSDRCPQCWVGRQRGAA